jgi:Ca2+-transporting ATPase
MTLEKFTPKVATPPKKSLNWHALGTDSVLSELATLAEHGLSKAEAASRLEEFGPNQLVEAPPPTFWQMLWEQFNNFVVWMLIVAAIVSAVLGDYIEAAAIMAIVILNATLGVVQERRAEQALAALRKLAAPDALVLRDGSRKTIPARELVPGDVVLIEAGNYIPADMRLIEAVNLRIEEAALTGESVPVQKDASARLEADIPLGDRKNTTFMGTLVSYGRGKGVVVGTGMRTQIGLIAEMLQSVEQEETPLQRRLDQLGKTLGWACLIICGIVFLAGWLFRGFSPLDMFIIAVSLAIAAVPEGLPAVVTISLALGMREMIHRHALIRRLSSVETLGSATVICSDKTGTLTQNEMTATRMWVDGKFIYITGSGYNPQGEFLLDEKPVKLADYQGALTNLWAAALNNDAGLEEIDAGGGQKSFRMVGDPTEGALIVAASKAGANYSDLNAAYPRVQEIPFDSGRKRMVTIHRIQDPRHEDASPFENNQNREWYVVTAKGAPDIVSNLCTHYQSIDDQIVPLDEIQRQRILAANDLMTQDALRVLGMAYKVTQDLPDIANVAEIETGLVFTGLIGMIDPPRPEVPPALEKGRKAGIRTVMITGDYPNTARAIAESIGLLLPGHQVLTGSHLNQLDDATLQKEVMKTDVFARVSPEHKMRIVEALRANGQVVAMTGDGVNDAPSIKLADIGVAMGITGTDVAKESADMVLTDDNYASIVAAVEQGRVIYSNIRKFVYYLLSCNLAEIATIFLGTLFTRGSPLTAIQLLWLNLITDGAPALALGTEKGDPDIMNQAPRPPTEPIINRSMMVGIAMQTIAITAVTLGAYLIGLHVHPQQPEFAETMAFVTLSFSELLRAYTARSERYPLLKIGVFKNRNMNLAVLSSALLLLAVIYIPFFQPAFNTTPLGWAQWELILPLLFIPSLAAEATKYFVSRTRK